MLWFSREQMQQWWRRCIRNDWFESCMCVRWNFLRFKVQLWVTPQSQASQNSYPPGGDSLCQVLAVLDLCSYGPQSIIIYYLNQSAAILLFQEEAATKNGNSHCLSLSAQALLRSFFLQPSFVRPSQQEFDCRVRFVQCLLQGSKNVNEL